MLFNLQKQPDAKLVVVGESDAKEKAQTAKEQKFALKHKHAKVVDLAAARAVNVKDYLVTEKGIDASRISVADRHVTDAQKVENLPGARGREFCGRRAGNHACRRVRGEAGSTQAPARQGCAQEGNRKDFRGKEVSY